MRVYLDERCLKSSDILPVLRDWTAALDLLRSTAPTVVPFLDSFAVREPAFLKQFNRIPTGLRLILHPIIFGGEVVCDWRPEHRGAGFICRIVGEDSVSENCAVVESYAYRRDTFRAALFGCEESAYAAKEIVMVECLDPPDETLALECGTKPADMVRIARYWGILKKVYDVSEVRPPRDEETVLVHESERFERQGRVERNGRRRVYRELSTGHFIYVDNLHYGNSAHLEVFDANGQHLGAASLDGQIIAHTRVPGRSISW